MATTSSNPALASRGENKSILLLDTDTDYLLELEQYLKMQGYFTQHIVTVDDLKNFLLSFLPDVIVCSITIAPYLRDIKEKIRGFSTETIPKVLILSNHGAIEDIRYAMKIGANDCISKTVSPEFIVYVIEAMLETKQ